MSPCKAASLMVGGAKVNPTARSLIAPETPTLDHWLSLSNLDRVVNPTYSSTILFYSKVLVARSNRTYSQIAQGLKETLARVLVEFYPLSGRLELRDDGLVNLHCNNQGAVFLEATVDADLEDLGGGQPMPVLSGLELAKLGPGPLYIPDQLNPLPALVIQVTQFLKCGSVAIVVSWHHTVADGSSGCHFMKSWSEVALGKDLSVKPIHDRDLLRPRNPLNTSLVNGYSTRCVQELVSTATTTVSTDPTILKSFPLTKHAVQGLKSEAQMDQCEYTSAEAISGKLWQLMTKARRDDEESTGEMDTQTTRFFMFVDGRKKLGLPAGYFGNVVCSACAVSKEGDILKKPASYAAGLIRSATRKITSEYFRTLIDWVEEQGNAPSKSEHVNSLGHDVAATFWTSFPLYDIDFGWGRPNLAARNSGPRALIDGIAMMPSPDGPGHMVALLNLKSDRMRRLQRDPAFSTIYSENAEENVGGLYCPPRNMYYHRRHANV